MRGKFVDDSVDFGFGSNVDAACRLVQNQDLGANFKPAREEYFLLITTRKSADDAFWAVYSDIQAGNRLLGELVQRRVVDDARARMLAGDVDRGVSQRREL